MTDHRVDQPISGKAVIYKRRGSYDVIAIEDRVVRAPGAGEIRIAVVAAAVNPTDISLRNPGFPDQAFPATPGMDAAGIVDAVGPDVSRFRIGDKVMAAVMPRRPEGGAQAAHIVVPAASVAAIPDGVTMAEAATLPMNGLTALRALELAGLHEGDWLAVSGGAGLLAYYTIAIARQRGLNVIADARPEDIDLVRGYGANVVIPRGTDFSAAVRGERPAGVDALIDTAVLGETAFGAIRDGGIYMPVRGWGDRPSVRGIEIRPVFVFQVLAKTEWLDLLRDLVATDVIRLRVAGEFSIAQVADAQRMIAAGGVRGRPVLIF